MNKRTRTLRGTLVSRVALVSLAAGVLAGCSSAVERFGEAPIYTGGTNNQRSILAGGGKQPSYQDIMKGPGGTAAGLPPVSSEPVMTGSITPRRAPAAVSRQNLPAVAMPTSAPMRSTPVATAPAPETRALAADNWRGWTGAGGTRIPVRAGDTVNSLSRRYGVPVEALVAVNGIEDPNQVRPGQMIVIPTYVYSDRNGLASQTASESRAVKPTKALSEPEIVTGSIRAAEALDATAPLPDRKPRHQPSFAEVRSGAVANDATPIRISTTSPRAKPSGGPVTASARQTRPVASVSGSIPSPAASPSRRETTPRVAVVTPTASAEREARPTEPIQRPQVVASVQPADAVAGPSFRWPVRGRIISDFGSKPGGARNDGVNLAVPEGTPVKAAGDGTVIYSGNELKGYGNLILVRHDDGWVSAYAHNSQLNVKRGDKVSRGDVIAAAGATGSVSQPQVHFELRKGNKPVDPLLYLPKS